MSLARDAQSSGDEVLAENYLQHAEHYNRIILAFREQQQQNPARVSFASGRRVKGPRRHRGRRSTTMPMMVPAASTVRSAGQEPQPGIFDMSPPPMPTGSVSSRSATIVAIATTVAAAAR